MQQVMMSTKLSPLEIDIWQGFILRRCGLYFTRNRLEFMRRRLWERMAVHKMQSYTDYYHYVAFNQAGETEWKALLSLLLNHETGFFRHPPSFDALTGHVLPQLMQTKKEQGLNKLTKRGITNFVWVI